jgi:TolB-like protein
VGRKRVWRSAATLLTLLTLLTLGSASTAQNSASVQTLCILDFSRLGDDARSDWLEQGLADMMISTMHSLSPYLVIERRHLKEILQEHGLTSSGLVDVDTAVRQARLAKAELLLQGSFTRQGEELTIQVRLIRVTDQRILAQATWTDRYGDVLSAPRVLTEKLHASLGSPFVPGSVDGIEHRIPTTIDVARSHYLGLRAFDDGRYPEALAHYLDAAGQAGTFRQAHAGVLEMYYLLGRSEHAVLFAREFAQSLEASGDVPGALEYYFAAASECLDPLSDSRAASELLEDLLRLIERHERSTTAIANIKRAVLDRMDELGGTGEEKIAADRAIRYQVWMGDIESELDRRAETQARGGYSVLENGTWIKRSVPPPSILMWKVRALHTLARAHARLGESRAALDRYRELLDEYAFLSDRLSFDGRLLSSIKTEAHFMWLRDYAATGRLIRDHAINRINNLNIVTDKQVFTRDFRIPPGQRAGERGRAPDAPDARARVASRAEGQGHEYFDFAAPMGYQIDSLTLRADVDGIAEFRVDLPQPAGWPPQYSLSRRFDHFKLTTRGAFARTVVLPPGTEFLSLGTSWGPGLYSNTLAEVVQRMLHGSKDGLDIRRWEVSFSISPKAGAAAGKLSAAAARPDAAVQALIDRYAAGWERGDVVRAAETTLYSANPRLDVFAEDWFVFSLDGDIRIFRQSDPRLEIRLPVVINSREQEFSPSLVRTHDGRYALLWARGISNTHASRFVAFSSDLLRWETPQRLVFEDPSASMGYTNAQLEPLERTANIVAVRSAYVMLLAQGFVRLSDDLRNWGPPRKAVPQDLYRNRLLKGPDGTIWAVYETSSTERQPYTEKDWLHGYFVTDGKRYRHVTELRVSRTVDGIEWRDAGKVVFPGQPSGLWVFAVGQHQIGITVGFNNLYAKWFTASSSGDLVEIDSQLQLFNQSEEAEFFFRDATLTCIRPVFDAEGQKPLLLATSTERVIRGSGTK